MAAGVRRIAIPSILPLTHPYIVYFARNGNRVKIGTTKALGSRLTQFGLASDNAVLVLEGGYELEDVLHTRFHDLRVERTEWFRLAPPLFTFIKACKAQPAIATLGGPEHEATWEDLDQIAIRTGRSIGELRSWRKDRTWPKPRGTSGGRRRLYHRDHVDNWIARHTS